MRFKCRGLYGKKVEGPALVSKNQISLFGDIADDGTIVAKDSDIRGEKVTGKVLIFPSARGSTVGSYVLLKLKKTGCAPLAIVNKKSDLIVASGAVIADVVLVDDVEDEFFSTVKSGDRVVVNAEENYVELIK
ncbi:MAG: DUF126 domain-containing protein [Archaeoglobales archaeon]|nr:DUF126 domain-containing protein [Archaeoglobales archaeon]